MRVESDTGCCVQILIYQIKYAAQILFVHRTEGIYERKSVRLQRIDHFDQFQKFCVRVAEYINRLNIKLVALFYNAFTEINDIVTFIFKKAGTDTVDGSAVKWLQIGDGITAVVSETDIRGLAAVLRQKWTKLSRIIENRAALLMWFVFQKSAFYDINATFRKSFDHCISKLCIYEIATIAQCAVK